MTETNGVADHVDVEDGEVWEDSDVVGVFAFVVSGKDCDVGMGEGMMDVSGVELVGGFKYSVSKVAFLNYKYLNRRKGSARDVCSSQEGVGAY